MATTQHELFVAKSGPRNRIGRDFIDYLRNGFGGTAMKKLSFEAPRSMGA